MRWIMKVKKTCAGILAVVMCLSVFTNIPPLAKAEEEKYPYTIFASSDTEGAVTVNADNFCLNGSIATNGTIVSTGSMNINGTKTEHAGEKMIYIFDAIEDKYFNQTDYNEYEEDYVLKEQNININTPMEVSGEVYLEGNINLSMAIKALEGISISGEVKNTNDSVIFSKYGDINIDSTNVNLNGLIYAPFGRVEITAQNLGLNSVIIIAEKVTISCSSFNANYSDSMGAFVGVKSETLNIPEDEKHYLDGKDIGEESSTEEGRSEDVYERYESIMEDFTNWDQYSDFDGDGLPDELEELIGSDKDAVDTDGDGLSDYYEFVILGTSPVRADTDDNGVNDAEEDFDGDGLSNQEEYTYGTSPWEEDTDEDGLTDGEEVYEYGTAPLKADTDGDGLLDGEELPLGFDPANPDTDGNGIIDGKEVLAQKYIYDVENTECVIKQVIIETETAGSLESATAVKSLMGKDVGCSNVAGLVGEPFEIETTSAFETAKLTFQVDKTELGETAFQDLLLIWYDEENGECVELETTHDEETGMVSTQTTHFSKYMLVDGKKWAEAWSMEYDYETEQEEDDTVYYSAMIFDCSVPAALRDQNGPGTGVAILEDGMPEYHATYLPICAQIGGVFADGMKDKDRTTICYRCKKGGFVYFDDSGNIERIKERFTSYDIWMKDGYWTYDDIALDEGRDYIDIERVIAYLLGQGKNETNVERRIFLVSGCKTTLPESIVDFARQRKVKIYTIGIGTYVDVGSLVEMSNRTGGLHYYLSHMDDLQRLLEKFGMADGQNTDTDGDGIPDVVEKAGMRNQFGFIIYTDPNNPDTDGDDLSDGEEIDPSLRHKTIFTGLPINSGENSYYFFMESNPTMVDTDGDSYSDYEEVTTYKTSPRYNDMEIYQLKHDYVSVENDDENKDYGGYQGWFANINETIKEYGCGLISACDVLLYLAQSDEQYATKITNNVTKEGNGRYNYDLYMAYLAYMENEYFHIRGDGDTTGINQMLDWLGQDGITGIMGTAVANKMNRYFDKYDMGLKADWRFSEKKLIPRIKEMLEDDIPVPIAANGIQDEYKELYPKKDENDFDWEDLCPYLYENKQMDDGVCSHEYSKSNWTFKNHYVTVTGLIIDGVTNKEEDKVWLHVSSWGESYYIKYSEYETYLKEYASMGWAATNIISIKKR